MTVAAPPPKISFVSLGCPKALVDSERIITRLQRDGYELSKSHRGADAVIVNTCGFLDSAKAESLDAIGAALADNGKVIVTGCLGTEKDRLADRFPDLIAVTGPQACDDVMSAVHAAVPPPMPALPPYMPPQGVKLTPRHYAYLKISEGCNNKCTFCIIPQLRGPLASRTAADVLREAETLVAAGVKELLVVAQDTSAYGLDIGYAESTLDDRIVRAKFIDLARELGSLGVWVRLHYVYPYPHVDEVIGLMAEGKILPYLDIPFQHASPAVLRAMRRPGDQEKTLDRIRRWRAACPDLTLRSTFIIGFPGETEQDFQLLLDWLDEARIERIGAFQYEPVAGARANDLGLPVVEKEIKASRYRRLMERAQAISARNLRGKIGRHMPVIIDRPGARESIGRTRGDAPAIDGKVHVTSRRPLRLGDIVTVKIDAADAYDLRGTTVN